MKKFLLLVITIISFANKNVRAQCSFTPTILPNSIIFCPDATDTLSTQVYDTYQWYKNGSPIAGATQQKLIIQQQTDEGFFFKVAVTKNGCRDTSKHVLADGYAFIPPDLIETGDIGIFDPKLDALVECPEDTIVLTLNEPYTENIQWYNNLKPIAGGNMQSYYVTKTGSYTVCGAPDVCPNYNVCESLPLNAYFEKPVATVKEKNDTLFASTAKKYQWFFMNRKIPGATQSYYVPGTNGVYFVVTEDRYTCSAVSNPFYFIPGSKNLISVSPNPVNNILHLHINANDAKQVIIVDLYGNQKLETAVTGNDQNIGVENINQGTYVVQIVNSTGLQIASAIIIKQ